MYNQAKQNEAEMYTEESVAFSQGKYHGFQWQTVFVLGAIFWVTCAPREGNVCGIFCSFVPWVLFRTFCSDVTQESVAPVEAGQTPSRCPRRSSLPGSHGAAWDYEST